MGMTAIYVMISATELDDVLIDGMKKVETIFWKKRADKECWFLGDSEDDDQLPEDQRNGFLWIDLGKWYRQVHWSLTGQPFPESSVWKETHGGPQDVRQTNEPLSLAMCAEDPVSGTEDFGYGPVRFLTPATVKNIAAVFAETTCGDLARNDNCDVEDVDEVTFEKIKTFYLRASKNGDAVLQYFV